MFVPSSKNRLTRRDLGRFGGDTLFDRVGRAVSATECLPRKELYEAWEVARRIRRRFRGGQIVDVGAGHGLLAHLLLLLDDSSPAATIVDSALPASHTAIHEAIVATWPRLAGRVRFAEMDVGALSVTAGDLVVSIHGCGDLTDRILSKSACGRARVAVLPCCHVLTADATGGLDGWTDGALAIDIRRAERLRQAGYQIWTQTIPKNITPKNRLLLGRPRESVESEDPGRRRGRLPVTG